MITVFDIVGFTGLAAYIYAHIRLQLEREFAKDIRFSILHFVASVLFVFSLMKNWNLPLFVANYIVMYSSLYGIYRCLKYMVREKGMAKHLMRRIAKLFSRLNKSQDLLPF